MKDKELAYAKQATLATQSWDIFQRLMRVTLQSDRSALTCSKQVKEEGLLQKGLLSLLILCAFSGFLLLPRISLAMTRTIKTEPAIVIAVFGTTTKAGLTYDFFAEQLQKDLPEKWQNAPVSWAYTSEIVRERANKKFMESGQGKRFRSLAQVLADLDDQGCRKIAVQSLHIFPGQEYEEMEKTIDAFRRLGLHIEYGGTLLHEWEQVFEAVQIVSSEFLQPDEGCNVLVAHGTPRTFPGSNTTYLGLDRYLTRKYSHVFIGGVDGVLTREQALEQVRKYPLKRVRLVPFMYVAGDHIMQDIMAEEPDKDGSLSWSQELKDSGIAVSSVQMEYRGEKLYKGLGFNPAINRMFIKQLVAALEKLKE